MLASIVLALAICLLSFYAYRKYYCHRFLKKIGLPGPKPHWLFGSLKELWATDNRHKVVHEWTKKYGKFFGYYEGATPIIVTSSTEAVEQICVKQYSNFQGHRVAPVQPDPKTDMNSILFCPNVFFAWGQYWKRLRTNINPAFTTGKLKSYMPLIQKSQSKLLDALGKKAKTGSFNIHHQFQLLTLDVISEVAFGVELNSLSNDGTSNRLLSLIREVLQLHQEIPPSFKATYILPELSKLLKLIVKLQAEYLGGGIAPIVELHKICGKVIEQRVTDPAARRNDLLQMLIDASVLASNEQANMGALQPLTQREIIVQSLVFFVAGTETTSTTLGYVAYLLATHQDVQDKLYNELLTIFPEDDDTALTYDAVMSLPYMERVCNETLRLYPVAINVVNRFIMDDTDVCGVSVPKECGLLMVDVYSIHHDPELWGPVDPYTFYPDRFTDEYKGTRPESAFLPFGFGPRLCVGLRLAMLEMKLTLAHVLRRFRIVPPAEGYANGLPLKVEVAMFPANGVQVQLIPRKV